MRSQSVNMSGYLSKGGLVRSVLDPDILHGDYEEGRIAERLFIECNQMFY